jgi:5-methylcytosine-specific restriction endonuclease McrA
MAERKPMSKKLRFEVFKRDSFTCQYCGKTPPLVVLEVDHIHPVSKGGSCGMDNLI